MPPLIPKPDSKLRALASLRLTIVCLSLLMFLVTACTLAQVHLGTFGAVKIYIRNMFVYAPIPRTNLKMPVFPGGGAVGVVLFVNLLALLLTRLDVSWRKAGLWLAHTGTMLLIVGEFATGFFQVETQMAIEEGRSKNYTESLRDTEMVLIDTSASGHDTVVSVPESVFGRRARIQHPVLPFTLVMKRYFENSVLSMAGAESAPSLATVGVGTRMAVREEPPVTADDQTDQVSAFVEVLAADKSLGTWLVSNGLGATQSFMHDGKTYHIALRSRRHYLPYSLTLKDFRHDVYPGTDIPKNFSSLVTLSDPERNEERDMLIYMNHPLRYRGKSFYQASFGKGDTLSVLQVVENPGRLLPYISSVMVFLGLILQFSLNLLNFLRRESLAA